MLYLVTGPEKSGKSARAEELAAGLTGEKIYLATMIPYQDEGKERVARHRRLRQSKGFVTIEQPMNLDTLKLAGKPVVLLECILNLAANELFENRGNREKFDPSNFRIYAERKIDKICNDLEQLQKQCSHLVVVTGELGEYADKTKRHPHPYDEETEIYMDAVKQINAWLCERAEKVISVVSDQPSYFPLFLDLSRKRVVVVGAGKRATGRVRVLSEFCSQILVVAPEGSSEMEQMEQNGVVHWIKREFRNEDVLDAYLVIAMTSCPEVNNEVAAVCREKQIMVNHGGDRKQCDFYFPGIAKSDRVVAGITSSGEDHRLAKELTIELRNWLGA